ncbi:putative P2 protein [Red clover RNA virus 1]|nr:putative P2 protein [Red clover RNA virus 1]
MSFSLLSLLVTTFLLPMASYKAFANIDEQMVEHQIAHLRAVANCLETCVVAYTAQVCENRCVVQAHTAMVPVQTDFYSQFVLLFSVCVTLTRMMGGVGKKILVAIAKFVKFI